MDSLWNEAEARSHVERYAGEGEAFALRVYTARLVGGDRELVVHGGGNASVKIFGPDATGEARELLVVKGSGVELAGIEPAGFARVELERLRRLAAVEDLSDAALANELALARVDASLPAPSVETLVHAYLPDAFVEHTHALAVLTFGNRPEGLGELAELCGDEVGVLPWLRSGQRLALGVASFRERKPDAIGCILHRHGVVSWGPDAQTSYERMIAIVDRVERALHERLAGRPTILEGPLHAAAASEVLAERAARVLPELRRFLALPDGDPRSRGRPLVCEWRPSPDSLAVLAAGRAELLATTPLTPDDAVWTKPGYLCAPAESEALAEAVAAFAGAYVEYFGDCQAGVDPQPRMADPFPRVVLVEGIGLTAWGRTKHEACVAADIAERTIRAKARADALSSYEGLSLAELFEIEYWALERAKLGAGAPRLAGRVALVTGAAGAIGLAVSRLLLERGAQVCLSDLPSEALDTAYELLRDEGHGDAVTAVALDVCDEASVRGGFVECVCAFGGLDVCVLNAGVAHVGALDALELADYERVSSVNERGTFLCLREAARVLKAQRLGGRIVLNASKNVPAPGADFGAYSASKAAAVQLARVAALELAEHGITVNCVHPDAVFEDEASGTSSGLWDEVGPERMRSRGREPEELRAYYEGRNLLGVEVRARDVAEAVLFFAEARTPTTGAALTVDGGNARTFYR